MKSEDETKGFLIAQLLMSIDEPKDMLAVVAAGLHAWCDTHDSCMILITEALAEVAKDANGLDIEESE